MSCGSTSKAHSESIHFSPSLLDHPWINPNGMWLVSLLLFWCFPRLPTGEGNGTPLQYSCLENPMDGGAWWAAVYGVTQSWTRLKRLSSSSSSSSSRAVPVSHSALGPSVATKLLCAGLLAGPQTHHVVWTDPAVPRIFTLTTSSSRSAKMSS